MATGMAEMIPAPPLRARPRGLLLDAAYEIPSEGDRWRAGVSFTPYGCDGLRQGTPEFCITGPEENLDDDFDAGECPVFEAFHIVASETGSALNWDSALIEGRLTNRFAAFLSSAVSAHLIKDTVGPSLASEAVIVAGVAATARLAIGVLETSLAANLHGAQGMIHLSPRALSLASESLEWDGRNWVTSSGHLVTGDAGHTDQFPDAGAASTTGWAYASGLVGYKVGTPRLTDPSASEYLDRTRNEIHGRRVAEAVIAFEPCPVSAVEFTFA